MRTPLPWRAYVGFDGKSSIRAEHYYIGSMDSGIPNDENKANAAYIVRACNNFEEILKMLKAVTSALRSYQYGNSSEELAEEIADAADAAIKKAGDD